MVEVVADGKKRCDERDWIDLPSEMLRLISKKLPDISYFILFRAVCRTWRSSVSISDPPPQLPWIIEQPSKRKNRHLKFHTRFTTSSNKIHHVICPEYVHKFSFTVSKKYILTSLHVDSSRCEYFLLNPFNNNEISLGLSERNLFLEAIEPNSIESDHEYLITLSKNKHKYGQWPVPTQELWRTISFRRLTDPQKVLFELEETDQRACLCYNGEYFYLDNLYGITKVIDVVTQKLAYEIPVMPNHSRAFWFYKMFESNGEIFMVRTEPSRSHFEIYKLNLQNGKAHAEWVKLEGIGDRVLFIDYNQAFCFSSRDYPILRGNCIYFLLHKLLYAYDLENRSTKILPTPFSKDNVFWFLPSLC